ncbi:MAG: C39 family peptidase [Actinomycetota bacterium]
MPLPDSDSQVLLQDVPYCSQETPYTCLPACLRMCLEWIGASVAEAELAALCHTGRLGTRPDDAAAAIASLGFEFVKPERPTIEWLASCLAADQPVIVGLAIRANGRRSLHAAVVIGIDECNVTLHDPQRGAEIRERIDDFRAAWELAGSSAITVAGG